MSVLIASAVTASTALAYGGTGSGTASDPHLVATCGNFADIGNDLAAHYLLTQNLDCASSGNAVVVGGGDLPACSTAEARGSTFP